MQEQEVNGARAARSGALESSSRPGGQLERGEDGSTGDDEEIEDMKHLYARVTQMVEAQKSHCWECLRRRLVCDFQVPGCKRCAASGIDCPGYGQPPRLRVKWLAPGKVSSRQRKSPSNHQKKGGASPEGADPEESRPTTSKGILESSSAGSQSSNDTHDVALPRFHLKTDYHALIDSIQYFDSCMYPQLAEALRFGTNTNIYKLSPAVFPLDFTRPAHLQLGLICLTLSHRMNQTGHNPHSKSLETSFYRYRGLMIHSLNEDISILNKQNGDIVLAGILTLLMADAQQGISQRWRYHIEGVRRLIMLRGGMHRLVVSPGVLPIILSFIGVVVTADTSSPASDLLVEGLGLEELCQVVNQYGGNGYGFQMCPPPLFSEIININHIRSQISKPNCINKNDFQENAREVLRRVYNFSPAAWIQSNGYRTEESKLIVDIHQSAVALYCMSSLQSIGALPSDPLLRKNCDMERQILHGLLERLLRQRPHGYTLWPLMVLGVQAVDSGPALRAFIREKMTDLSASSGTYAPLAAKEVLERFWASGRTEWDACFEKPHMFTTVLTVNRGQLPRRP
ncbi:C6 zinc finger domain-containing protein [Paecilomyces variotii No. 5]|uniref:C6 zinc finger domain-containing protein n=1 Tax=Byssochlamys spectabilis (strain No. 5 / NBRC 109023) TaxID=1356009 RepID=V5FPN0_BYSSN|nr:C6 zinc finger domain-containing protein [Paecilomyces variotii No. 5]